MIKVLIGDLFKSNAQTLVNTVNCVGIMGKGIALEFKKRFPDMYEDYVARCKANKVKLGKPYLYVRPAKPWILNFPTKDHWRSVSKLSDIVDGLNYLIEHYKEWGIESLAVPALGCGHGQLEWRVIGPTLYRYLARLDIPVELYAPYGTPTEQLEIPFLSQAEHVQPSDSSRKIRPAWVALVEILARIYKEPYHRPIGRTMFQKIAYFATESGLPTGLRYVQGSYGPFAQSLKLITTRLVNNGLLMEQRNGRMFVVKPGPTYEDTAAAYSKELSEWNQIIENTVDLALRMHTKQAEIAATVHFVAERLSENNHRPSETDVLNEVRRWKQKRRPPLKDDDISQTIRHLNILGWIDVRPSSDLPIAQEDILNL